MLGSVRLAVGEVHLWRKQVDADADVHHRLEGLLSDAERLRAQRIYGAHDRRLYVTSHVWLRRLLAQYLDADPHEIRFVRDANGKPRLRDPSARWLRFSLSHSADLAVIGITCERELGVDVERVRGDIDVDSVARRFFSSRERGVLAALAPEERIRAFFAYWTMKEAYLKATGAGLGGARPDFAAPLRPGEAVQVVSVSGDTPVRYTWRMQAFDLGVDYTAAVAIEGEGAPIPRVAREFGHL